MRQELLKRQLAKKIMILDGAMGTMLQKANLTRADFGGEEYEGCNEMLNLTRPDVIQAIHEEYLTAGADIIETNTFGATGIVLEEYGCANRDSEINEAAARIARQAAARYSTPEHPRFVAGSIGPTTKMLSLTGGVTFEELAEAYFRQAKGLLQGGVDLLLIETAQDALNVKAAGIGINRAFAEYGETLPVMVSGTIEATGTTLAGQNIEAFYVSLEHLHPIAVGLNCATGPEFMRDHLRSIAQVAQCGVSCYPNAGLPDEEGHYHESPEGMAKKMAAFAAMGWLNIAGGCCGTTPDHVRALAQALRDYVPRQLPGPHPGAVSGIEVVYVEEDNRPLLVGERTNVIGSRKFRQLIANGQYEEGSDIAVAQVKKGAHIVDICLADPDRDEYADLEKFMPYVVRKVKAPLMFDSTNPEVMELGLQQTQGKAIINSINLEDGLKRFAEVAPLIRKYGASVVVGMIDEEGMAVTRERKLAVAKRSYDLLINRFGLSPQDIIFDPLVFPVGTGDSQYLGSALETVEGIRLIKTEFPQCQTILGISNVSFGLPPAGREVLNSAFLYHTTRAGLDYAIVNTEKLERYASLPAEERELAEAVLFNTNDENLTRFIEFYRQKATAPTRAEVVLTLEERIARYVIEGTKDGLIADLNEALATKTPLEIINGPLMRGMEEVGRLFNANQLIVVEVLQSAEVMKAAVSHLEPFLSQGASMARGKVLLASVKGDVHDIGKNLVEIILANNGYEVVNLGIKAAPEQIIEAYRKERPDVIGLSGLLVKSAQQMLITAQDLKAAGIDAPLILGGAALTRKFTETRIAPEYGGLVLYAKDAMDGLDLINKIQDPVSRAHLATRQTATRQTATLERTDSSSLGEGKSSDDDMNAANSEGSEAPAVSSEVRQVGLSNSVYLPPDLERHVLKNYPLSQLKPYLNLQMLLGKHLGVKGAVGKLLAEGDEKAQEVYTLVEEFFVEAMETGLIKASGIYQFFPAQADGNDIIIYDPEDQTKVLERFSFLRQAKEPYLCLADFVRPVQSGEMDYVGFFTVTAGQRIREQANIFKERGDYLRSHVLQALALELAEAFAERLHHIMREEWGFPDAPELTMQERFNSRYQGVRVSFGYPACPNMEDQVPLFHLIHPEDIGIRLTEGFMMDPEASVTAMVFANPHARIFNVN